MSVFHCKHKQNMMSDIERLANFFGRNRTCSILDDKFGQFFVVKVGSFYHDT